MKNFDLSTYGVEEMNDLQMKDVDGGGWWGTLVEVMVHMYSDVNDAWVEVKKEGGKTCVDMPFK